MASDLCQPASHSGLGSRLHGNRAAGLYFEYVLQNSDPLLEDVGRIRSQVEGLLLCDQLIRGEGGMWGQTLSQAEGNSQGNIPPTLYQD